MSEAGVNVKVEERRDGRVARVMVDNAGKLNCLSTPLIVAMTEAFAELGEDRSLRAVVLTGAGNCAFIGGADLNELGGLCADSARLFITRLHVACKAIRDCPLPVIGRINGFCLGAGLEVAASCYMRAAADGAHFGMPEVHMGLPSVIEAALLPGLIGWGRTREMLLTGALSTAAEALAMGFVQKAVPAAELDAAVETWLVGICRATPEAGPRAEGADEPLGARVGGGGRDGGHRRPRRGLQDRRAAGRDQGVLRRQEGEPRLTAGPGVVSADRGPHWGVMTLDCMHAPGCPTHRGIAPMPSRRISPRRRNNLRPVLEVHGVVVVPLAAPDEAVLLEDLDDLQGMRLRYA